MNGGPRAALRFHPAKPDESDPPRKFYGFKPRAFEPVNTRVPLGPEAAPPVPDPGVVPTTDGPIDVQELTRLATAGRPLLSTEPTATRENDVHGILRENHAVANAAGLNRVAPVVRPHRRRRDFRLLMIFGNGFIATVYWLEIVLAFQVQCLAAQMPGEFYNLILYAVSNPIFYILPIGCMAFFSAAVAWLLYGVLDDY